MVVVIIAFGAVVAYLYLKQPSSSTTNAVITNFEKGSGSVTGPPNNQYFLYPFNVTILNQGNNDVSGLTVVVEVLGNGNILGSETTQVGTLQAGHQYSFTTSVSFSGNSASGKTQTYTALLEQNNLVINQSNLG